MGMNKRLRINLSIIGCRNHSSSKNALNITVDRSAAIATKYPQITPYCLRKLGYNV